MTRTLDQHERIAKTSRRRPANEAGLVWTFCGIAGFVGVFVLMMSTPSIPVPLGLSFLGFIVLAGLTIGGALAVLWYLVVSRIVARAKTQHAKALHASF